MTNTDDLPMVVPYRGDGKEEGLVILEFLLLYRGVKTDDMEYMKRPCRFAGPLGSQASLFA